MRERPGHCKPSLDIGHFISCRLSSYLHASSFRIWNLFISSHLMCSLLFSADLNSSHHFQPDVFSAPRSSVKRSHFSSAHPFSSVHPGTSVVFLFFSALLSSSSSHLFSCQKTSSHLRQAHLFSSQLTSALVLFSYITSSQLISSHLQSMISAPKPQKYRFEALGATIPIFYAI